MSPPLYHPQRSTTPRSSLGRTLALTSALITLGLSATLWANPNQPSPDQLEAWLAAHKESSVMELRSAGGLKGQSRLELRQRGDFIELWEESDALQHGSGPVDDYQVTRKRFQRAQPHSLVSMERYQLRSGEASAGAWRAHQPGQPEGSWVEAHEVKRISRRARAAGAEPLKLATALWSSGAQARALTARERLTDHLLAWSRWAGAELNRGGAAKETATVESLEWGRVERLKLSLTTRRLVRAQGPGHSGAWLELIEVKSVDQEGYATRALLDMKGRTLSSSSSDQLSITRAGWRGELRSYNELSAARGRLSEGALQASMRPARAGFERCSRRFNQSRDRERSLTLKLNLSPSAQLTAISFEGLSSWSAFERCVAERVSELALPAPSGGEALITFPLRFKPAG